MSPSHDREYPMPTADPKTGDSTDNEFGTGAPEQGESQVLGKNADSLCLCYMSCPKDGANGYIGAVLVTDSRTRPTEFSYVAPVRPSAMQRILYGKTLDEYVSVDVIARKLLDGLSKKPDIVFVDSDLLLGLHRFAGQPVAMLTRSKDVDPSVKISAVAYKTPDDANYTDEVGAAVSALESYANLVDPFERMTEALKEALKTAKA